ncbi:PF11220 family protein [Leptospira wolbachii serovar Codice str. CDC]|uniref:PF11220 family protein n=2 Tax=Leptospira TaxID=171 RepID=R9A2L0_9LEPT|nr:PF11220 family protein [Leptospira wolbachii serovar Codice str. CDC]
MAGCGLGSMVTVWKNDIGQVLAATTNVSFSSQTFGITSGTSNCTTDGIVRADRAQEVFITYNEEPLELETARGTGERIRAIASLLGCPTHSVELGKLMKEKHSFIFDKTQGVDSYSRSKVILSRLKSKIAEDFDLKKACLY